MKLITVIIPVYNVKSYLQKCIESVEKQSYKNLEIILIDDGSNDGSFSICEKFAKKDNRIKFYHTKNSGLSHARNVGLDHATGEYIVFVDSDDYIHKDMINTMVSKVGNADLVICNYEKILSNGNKKISQDAKCLKDDNWNSEQFWEHYYLGNLGIFCCVVWNKLYKKELFKGIRYPINKIHEDEYIINDIIERCSHIKVISDSLYYYVQRQGSIMHSSYKGHFDGAEAFLNRCVFFEKYDLTRVLKKNLDYIPVELVMGLNETKGQKNSKMRYRLLREKYDFFLKKYLKENFSIKLYLKKYMLMMPALYSLYIKIRNYLKLES